MNPLKSLSKWVISGLSGKTLWEWLELLIVPLGLAFGAFYLESQVEGRQANIAEERYKQERNIAAERANQEVLDSYLEKMQGLLLDKDLRNASVESEVRSVARAITTTAMRDLDAARNALLIDFLRESNLVGGIGSSGERNTKSIAILPKLNLSNADLSKANLNYTDLNGADLSGANLEGADLNNSYLNNSDLKNADLEGADLYRTNLNGADLSGADLSGAKLIGTELSGTDLRGADLRGTVLSDAGLSNIILCKTQLPDGTDLDPNRNCM